MNTQDNTNTWNPENVQIKKMHGTIQPFYRLKISFTNPYILHPKIRNEWCMREDASHLPLLKI